MSSVSVTTNTTAKHQGNDGALSSRVQKSLEQLPSGLQQLNRTYVRQVNQRSLIPAADASSWIGSQVSVFLRHDKVCVFAIVRDDVVAMADFVTLSDATFHVDEFGRSHSNAELGPLPNLRTVHAYLTGELVEIADFGTLPDSDAWSSVVYNPSCNTTFVDCGNRHPVHSSAIVRMVPGAAKVWIPTQRRAAE